LTRFSNSSTFAFWTESLFLIIISSWKDVLCIFFLGLCKRTKVFDLWQSRVLSFVQNYELWCTFHLQLQQGPWQPFYSPEIVWILLVSFWNRGTIMSSVLNWEARVLSQ
jgi:hypothetical protein